MNFEDIGEVINRRGIQEILHFTTSNGLVGIVSSGYLLAHSELPKTKILSHITQLNCPDRSRDIDWHHYVNLSISRVNGSFFSISRNRWHAKDDIYWCVLGFSPEILMHEGVHFSTTNNAYNTTKRGTGLPGLEALFAQRVKVFPDRDATRDATTPLNFATCSQAEVLYPIRVSLDYLKSIYVPTEDYYYEAKAQVEVCDSELAKRVDIKVAPEYFE